MEDLPHILLPKCPHLQDRADILLRFANDLLLKTNAGELFTRILKSEDNTKKVQMMLDPAAVPEIICAAQKDETVLPLLLGVTTIWCYSLNHTIIKLLGI